MTQNRSNLLQVSFLIACGSALQLAEYFIPYPIPGMRIGLANISTVLGIVLFGGAAGFEIAVFRPIITSLTNGTFLSPGFIFSFFGSITSYLVMFAIFYLTKKHRVFSIIGISIIGAIAHNVTQIATAYFWLLPHAGVLTIAPLLLVSGLVGGYFVGWASDYVLAKIREAKFNLPEIDQEEKPLEKHQLILGDKLKILAAFGMVITTIFLATAAAYAALIAIVTILILISGDSLITIIRRIFALWGVIIGSFMLPVIFTTWGEVYYQVAFIKITDIGVYQGILFVMRLIFLILISIWIGVTDPEKLSRELAWLLSPLKVFKVPVDRIPRLTSLSLSFLPLIWERLSKVKPKKLKLVLDALVGLFMGLEKAR